MNNLTSQQRKLVYLIGIIVLLIPIINLSLPSDGLSVSATGKKNEGGKLSQLRSKYDLGESDLGNVDASGAAINLVLLGMRGVAVNLLWIEMDEQKDMKRWAEMQATTESIVRLQPHYEKVWDIMGWNLAYNTSAEWDAVPDRFFWVKQGAKLLQRGVKRNFRTTELYYRTGKVIQHKIGYADESVDYRKYFVSDPDPAFHGGPDQEINPNGEDNFLVGKNWFTQACEWERHRAQHILDRSLFRSTPARCQIDYAQALQKDGKFGEQTRAAWELAREDWTQKFGKEIIRAQMPTGDIDIFLEIDEDGVKQIAKTPDDELRVRHAVDQYQKVTNYRYWRTRAVSEAEPETAEAHRSFYEAKEAYINQEFEKAQTAAFNGMQGFDNLMKRPEFEELKEEDTLVEECMLGWKIWDDLYQLKQEKAPEEFPLKWLVVEKVKNDSIMTQVKRQFRRLFLDRR